MFERKTGSQRYFDGWASRYERDLARYQYAVPQVVFDALRPRVSGRNAPKLLDIGIGTGLSSALFRDTFPELHITGVDIAQNMLDTCRAHNLADRLFRCDVSRDTLPPGPYEAIIAAGILEFIEHADEIIEKIARNLKTGGYAALAFETPATAGLYRPKIFSGIVDRKAACVAIRRVHTRIPWPHVYTKYLHAPQYLTHLAAQNGLTCVENSDFVAYTRGNGDVVTHALLVFRK